MHSMLYTAILESLGEKCHRFKYICFIDFGNSAGKILEMDYSPGYSTTLQIIEEVHNKKERKEPAIARCRYKYHLHLFLLYFF